MLLVKYIQDESTKTLIFYIIVSIVIGFLISKWIISNRKKAEEENEYYHFLSDYRLYGALIILLIGFVATVAELLKRV
ncbi:hypothetical protein HKT18_09100 [Flavobacterium sp. IMCC34852]|uniref:Uncharacterized protein n=1 Tax=Flavobacterium rivulicola TaxID=2732161 RepID=A0A7Y3R9G7_9FLAO|nr:hypothetical protein [Flavobacterium sp. IMCC34852]NNT72369.1 hypothetical protein [Flavobacterium sp. IMCC34852]